VNSAGEGGSELDHACRKQEPADDETALQISLNRQQRRPERQQDDEDSS
jgi:hypothetical protein